MRILHTSDWHLGKYLEMCSRLPEQREFIDQLVEITEEKKADIVVVAGDVYDTNNPPAEAEKLFYEAVMRLSAGGQRPILIIAGNHDSPERLTASGPLASAMGIIIIGGQKTIATVGDYGGFSILEAGEGYVEIKIGEESLVVLTLPYPSERRLNELFMGSGDEKLMQKSYSDKIESMFVQLSEKYREDTINIAVGHFYINGGETTDSERGIQLGGGYAVNPSALPEKAQYIAMGHLHRHQRVAGQKRGYYAGSPIQYSKNEINYAKCVLLAEITPGNEPEVEKIYLRNYKPIEIWKADSIEDAISMCKERSEQNSWVYLEIKTHRALTHLEMKEMRSHKKDIVEIFPQLQTAETGREPEIDQEKTMAEEFIAFYSENRGVPPTEVLTEMFGRLAGSDEV